VLFEGATPERIVAESANKVLWMPLLAEGIDTASSNRKTATSADGTSDLMIVLFAIRLTLVFKVCTTSKALVAVEAGEVVRMPPLTHGVDELTTDGLTTAGALEGECRVEATLTEGMTVTLQEARGKGLETLRAHEVLRVPLLAKGSHTTISDGLIAVSAVRAVEALPALTTSWLTIALIEGLSAKRLTAALASKVLRMPHLAHSLNDLTSDRLVATATDTTSRSHGRI